MQDSLELLSNLLRGNPSNQEFLRETIGLSRIPHLLALAHPGGGPGGPGSKGGGDARDAGGAVGALVQGLGADGEAFGVSRQKVGGSWHPLTCLSEQPICHVPQNTILPFPFCHEEVKV